MKTRQKEDLKLITTKDKLRQHTDARSGTKVITTATAADMQRKHGQYTLAKKRYTIKRNSRAILYNNKQPHSDIIKYNKAHPSSKDNADGNAKEISKTSETGYRSNVLLRKKAVTDLRIKKDRLSPQGDHYLRQLSRQENDADDSQTSQRNAFDEANEEAVDKLYQHGRTIAQKMIAPNKYECDQHSCKEQRLTATIGQNSSSAAQAQFMRTRNARYLYDKQKKRQTTIRQSRSVRQPLPARQQDTTLPRSPAETNATKQQINMNSPTTKHMHSTMQTQTVNRNKPPNKILRSVPHLHDSTAHFISNHTLTTEQSHQKRRAAATHDLLKKRLRSKAIPIGQTPATVISANLSYGGSMLSLAAERRFIRIVQAAGRTIRSLFFSLASAGTMIILVLAFFAAFAALLFSPFGIFFSGQDGDNHSIAMAVAEINRDFNAHLDEIESSVIADSIIYHRIPDDGGSNGDGRFITNWTDIIAVFAVRTAGGNDTNSMDVLTIDATRIDLLKDIFNDMNTVTYKVETIHHPSENEADTDRTERILHITITSKNYAEMPDLYNFTTAQQQALDEIMKPEYAQMLSELVGTYGNVSGGTIVITNSDLRSLLAKLPTDLSPHRQEVIATAFSLVGKVNYFWGGKSHIIGWDDRWGTPTKVTAAGSRTTGTTRPFGLDCSGFVDWVFINAVGTNVGQGGGAASQYAHSTAITWQDAQHGDLVFYPDLGHVGIICGKDDNGNLLVVHCASSQNNVVVTGLNGFTLIRRPTAFIN